MEQAFTLRFFSQSLVEFRHPVGHDRARAGVSGKDKVRHPDLALEVGRRDLLHPGPWLNCGAGRSFQAGGNSSRLDSS